MKKVLSFCFVSALALMLTGCINYAEEISLNPDGSGTWVIDYSISEEMMDATEGMAEDNFDTAEIEKSFEGKELKLNKVDTFSKDGFRHVVMETSFTDISQLVEMMEGRELKFTANEDGTYTFYAMMPGGGGMMEDDSMKEFTWTTVVNLPGEVAESTGTVKGRTVTWEIPLTEVSGTEMSATVIPSAMGGSMMLWYILGGVVIVLAALFFTMKKKK
ncbi:MAG: LPXTG cell wall anchor domain-containing protein [Candidatus Gracilibacteria bacterium]|nr:LPXTG cell wall anchor domain-containing protein [Candidatus Gracilibacteria bacterium]